MLPWPKTSMVKSELSNEFRSSVKNHTKLPFWGGRGCKSIKTNIKKMEFQNTCDINKPNQPFKVIGKIVPIYNGEKWSFEEEVYPDAFDKCYPNDDIHYDEYINNPDKVIFLCYSDEECIGQIRLRKNWNKYCYIEDIAVSSEFRGIGIGKSLLQTAISWAKSGELCGIMLETQDLNISACRFYKKCGFKIGGVDTMLYGNFENSHEKAIFWYMKFE